MKSLQNDIRKLAADPGLGTGPVLSGAIAADAGDEIAAGVAPTAVQQEQAAPGANSKRTRRGERPLEMAEEWYANDLWHPAYRGPLLDFQARLSDSCPGEEADDDQFSRG